MGTAIDVTSATFEQDVLQRSHQSPVLVDFFATWCGPCKLLAPMLENLAPAYGVALTKVDIDQNPDIASTYGVEGVPDVRIVAKGEVQPGFVGVLPEPQLRDFLAQVNVTAAMTEAVQAFEQALSAGQQQQAATLAEDLLAQFSTQGKAVLPVARFYLKSQQFAQALAALEAFTEGDRALLDEANALQQLLQLHQRQEATDQPDLDSQFFGAVSKILEEQYEPALDSLLDLVGRDRNYRQDGARQLMLQLFTLLGDEHETTKIYRKRLMRVLW